MSLLRRETGDKSYASWDPLTGEIPKHDAEYPDFDPYCVAEQIIARARRLIEDSCTAEDNVDLPAVVRKVFLKADYFEIWPDELNSFSEYEWDLSQLLEKNLVWVDKMSQALVTKVDPPKEIRHVVIATLAIALSFRVVEAFERDPRSAVLEPTPSYLRNANHLAHLAKQEKARETRRKVGRESRKHEKQQRQIALDHAAGIYDEDPDARWGPTADEVEKLMAEELKKRGEVGGLKDVPSNYQIKNWIKPITPADAIRPGRPSKKKN